MLRGGNAILDAAWPDRHLPTLDMTDGRTFLLRASGVSALIGRAGICDRSADRPNGVAVRGAAREPRGRGLKPRRKLI